MKNHYESPLTAIKNLLLPGLRGQERKCELKFCIKSGNVESDMQIDWDHIPKLLYISITARDKKGTFYTTKKTFLREDEIESMEWKKTFIPFTDELFDLAAQRAGYTKE